MAATQPEYIAALDYGEKRVGVAIAHQVARLPRPLTTLHNDEQLFANVEALVVNEQVGLVLVGLPRGMDGGYTDQTRAAEAFQKQLAETLSVPVVLADETLTSIDAEQSLAGSKYTKEMIDAVAAGYILERYLAEHAARKES